MDCNGVEQYALFVCGQYHILAMRVGWLSMVRSDNLILPKRTGSTYSFHL